MSLYREVHVHKPNPYHMLTVTRRFAISCVDVDATALGPLAGAGYVTDSVSAVAREGAFVFYSALMLRGRVIEPGPPDKVLNDPREHRTRSLLSRVRH